MCMSYLFIIKYIIYYIIYYTTYICNILLTFCKLYQWYHITHKRQKRRLCKRCLVKIPAMRINSEVDDIFIKWFLFVIHSLYRHSPCMFLLPYVILPIFYFKYNISSILQRRGTSATVARGTGPATSFFRFLLPGDSSVRLLQIIFIFYPIFFFLFLFLGQGCRDKFNVLIRNLLV